MATIALWLLVIVGACALALMQQIASHLSAIRARLSYYEKMIDDEGVISGQIGFLINRLTRDPIKSQQEEF
jgi:hypothetical protein